MPSSLRIPVIGVILIITGFLWIAFIKKSEPGPGPNLRGSDSAKAKGPSSNPSGAPGTPGATKAAEPGIVDTTNTDPRFIRFTDGIIHFQQSFTTSRDLHESSEPRADLEVVSQLMSDYRLVFKENPVGTENAEIVAQLLGENPKKVYFIDPEIPALTAAGELLDRWGSPYIFHPLKSDLMDVRSIGPDRKPWTDDDLSLGLDDTEEELLLYPTQ